MDMETVSQLYLRVGGFLPPTLEKNHVDLPKQKNLIIYDGICQRTGLHGKVVNKKDKYIDIPIPTLAKLLWIFSTHKFTKFEKDDVVKTAVRNSTEDDEGGSATRINVGRVIALTDKYVLGNLIFENHIPNFKAMTTNDILREIHGKKSLFMGFSNKPVAVLGNGLRWSMGDQLEVNGSLKLGNEVVQNSSVNLGKALAITRLTNKKTASDLRYLLRPGGTFGEPRSETQNQKLQKLASQVSLEVIRTIFNASENEMRLAYRIWDQP